MAWADLYGGAAILLGIDDGAADPKLPLDLEKGVKNFNFATVLSRYELKALTIQDNPLLAGYGLPATYTMEPRITAAESKNNKTGAEVHASRLIIFQGSPLPRKTFITNGYWGDSILSILYRPLQNYGTTHDSVASLMQDFSQAVFKIQNLADILSAKDGKALIKERINMVELSRSVINATIIADTEEFERKTTSLAGVQEIIEKMERRLVSTTSYPHTILLGESPGGGIGNDGKAQHRDYYDFVSRRQESILKQPLRRFIHLVMSAKEGPTKGKVPVTWDIEFMPLWQDSESDIMEQRKKQAEADQIYITNQVLSPDEVALARFGGPRYSHDMKLLLERDGTKMNTGEDDPDAEEVDGKIVKTPAEPDETKEPAA
jgi:phage-related protein (TIGR01555 family)